MEDLKERLLAVKYTRERGDGPGGLYWDEPCDAEDHGAEPRLVNPIGPEAASRIAELEAQLTQAAAAERASVVKWLRVQGACYGNGIGKHVIDIAADAIEQGAHHEGEW